MSCCLYQLKLRCMLHVLLKHLLLLFLKEREREREREALWRQSVVTLQCGDNGNGIREYFIRFFFSKKSQGAMAPAPLLPVREREYHIIYQLLSIYRICIFSQFKYICLNCNYKIKKKKKRGVQ